MSQRNAGQHWNASSNTTSGQWAWRPVNDKESWLTWGHSSTWPVGTTERFIRDDEWVRLDGWHDAGGNYELRTTVEWVADADCQANRASLVPGGAQRYVKWEVPERSYCMFAAGTIRQVATNKLIAFAHQQVWSVEQCTNAYLGARACLKQVERWWDDNGTPWTEKVNRAQWLGKGAGMAYRIDQHNNTMELRYAWTW
jgi:hypothetical protein